MTTTAMWDVRDSAEFRRVLGHVPTGVVVVTSTGPDGEPVGMSVGSFTSVSLDPPLVGFLPARTSSTFPKIQQAGHFCVNVLSADQEDVCRSFARPGDKFGGIDWTADNNQAPHLDGAVAWIDCSVESVSDAGDHYVVLGRVHDLQLANDLLPLVFFQGGYGRFASHSLGAPPEPDLVSHLRLVDHARPIMERAATQCGIECLATAAVGTELVVLASTGDPNGRRPPTRVGQRLPFQPPMGAPLVAWSEAATTTWLKRSAELGADAATLARQRAGLARVHDRGWSIGLGSPSHRALEHALGELPLHPTPLQRRNIQRLLADGLGDEYEQADLDDSGPYPVRNLGVPVFDAHRNVSLMLTLYGFPRSSIRSDIDRYTTILQTASAEITAALGTSHP
jgi:flavin reductase (DIM6/NTAB) family NADH-FMN oxidoreductase RutF/DNA-binding IclR family transcriptional regulator